MRFRVSRCWLKSIKQYWYAITKPFKICACSEDMGSKILQSMMEISYPIF
ncbi:hypothetical protein PAHAL_8G175000 [Panicum hallii]|uniref:Uncharacterized protein n=1 Tax=Panicum hallii TaxID=206008 RepID=A0A2T8I981_9POAL|nr:hypothetical protein PAHAL_8G175000 [Panicum hallii]